MSNYTRLNRTNHHYHDSGSSCSKTSIQHREAISPEGHPRGTEMVKFEETSSLSSSLPSTINMNYSTLGQPSDHDSTNRGRRMKLPSKKGRLMATNNNNSNLKFAFFAFIMSIVFVLLICITNHQVYSLNCYHCSSIDNPGCDEAFSGKDNITDTDCEKFINQPAKVCRKIVQYIEHKKVVIRSCGFIDEHDDKDKKTTCYKRSGTFAIMMESCNCYTDNCNHSASLVPNQSVLLSQIVVSYSLLLILMKTICLDRSRYIYESPLNNNDQS